MAGWVALDTDVAIVQVAAAAGTDSGRTRGGPDSAVDRAAREVNESAVVHLGPDWLPAMATTSLVRTDAAEDTATDGWDRNWVPVELDIVAGRALRKVVVHCRVDRVHLEADALEVDDLAVEVVGQHGRHPAAAAADQAVARVEIVGHLVAAAVAGREVGSYQGSVRVGQEGTVTDRESWHPVVEDDTVAGSPSAGGCRDGVVVPIPAGVHRTTAAVARKVDVVVDPVVAAVALDPVVAVSAAAAAGSGRNCWDSDAGRAEVVAGAIVVTSLGSE